MARAYCTYFDSGYLSRGLALIESLRAHGDDSPVWVMTLDEPAKAYLDDAALPGVITVTVADLEGEVDGLLPLKTERSRMEYYFTTTPLLVEYVMNHSPEPASVAYLDSDLYFFDDPGLVFEAMGDSSVGIIAHGYPARLARRLAKYGTYNVGWVGFAPDAPGRECLHWWGRSTLEWCEDTPQDGRYADQGYLDQFPVRFAAVGVLAPAGLNLAPWNTATRTISASADGVTVDGDPLVFFHFHGVKRTRRWWMTSQLVYEAPMNRVLRDRVYEPYLRRLEHFDRVVAASSFIPKTTVARRGTGLRGVLFRAQRAVLGALNVLTRNALRAG